jgi:hypothetical protein
MDDKVFRKNENVVARKVADEVIIVPIRHNVGDLDSVYTLNPVAARVWSLLDGARSAHAVADLICEEFDVTRDVAERDLGELFESLEEAKLITAN